MQSYSISKREVDSGFHFQPGLALVHRKNIAVSVCRLLLVSRIHMIDGLVILDEDIVINYFGQADYLMFQPRDLEYVCSGRRGSYA